MSSAICLAFFALFFVLYFLYNTIFIRLTDHGHILFECFLLLSLLLPLFLYTPSFFRPYHSRSLSFFNSSTLLFQLHFFFIRQFMLFPFTTLALKHMPCQMARRFYWYARASGYGDAFLFIYFVWLSTNIYFLFRLVVFLLVTFILSAWYGEEYYFLLYSIYH